MASSEAIVENQRRILRQLLRRLRPCWRKDAALPRRIERMLRADRRLGSGDRRLYRELIYTALRYLPWIEALEAGARPDIPTESAIAWLAADLPATARFRSALLSGWPPCPESVEGRAARLGMEADAVLPDWLKPECPEAFSPAQRDALCRRAPLWLRVRPGRIETVRAELNSRGWSAVPSEIIPAAVRVSGDPGPELISTESWKRGWCEIQDIGSQAILQAASVEPAGRWLDACAGAGGKTLQLADLLGPEGSVDASDIRPKALAELLRRADRAELSSSQVRLPKSLAQEYDGILVDAPCSGSGTWRRFPHLKWTTRPSRLPAYAARQLRLLHQAASRVRPGGRLVYATCSLCRTENDSVAERFLSEAPDFRPEPWPRTAEGEVRPPSGLQFWPAGLDGDGFYAALFRKSSGS